VYNLRLIIDKQRSLLRNKLRAAGCGHRKIFGLTPDFAWGYFSAIWAYFWVFLVVFRVFFRAILVLYRYFFDILVYYQHAYFVQATPNPFCYKKVTVKDIRFVTKHALFNIAQKLHPYSSCVYSELLVRVGPYPLLIFPH